MKGSGEANGLGCRAAVSAGVLLVGGSAGLVGTPFGAVSALALGRGGVGGGSFFSWLLLAFCGWVFLIGRVGGMRGWDTPP